MMKSAVCVCVLTLAICYVFGVARAAPVNKVDVEPKDEQVKEDDQQAPQNGETASTETEPEEEEKEDAENGEDDDDKRTETDEDEDDKEEEIKRMVKDQSNDEKMAALQAANQLPPLDYGLGGENEVLKPDQVADYLYKDDPYGEFDIASDPEKLVHSIAMRIYMDNDVTDFESIMNKLLTYGVITDKEAEEFEDAVAEDLRQIVLAEDRKLFQAAKGVDFVKDPNPQYNEGLNLDYGDNFLIPQTKSAYKTDAKSILDEESLLDALKDEQKEETPEKDSDPASEEEEVKDTSASDETEEEPEPGQAITKEEPRDGGDNADSDFNNEIDNDEERSDETDGSDEEEKKGSNEEEEEVEEKELVIDNGKTKEFLKEKQEAEGEGDKEDEKESEEESEVINDADLDTAGEKEEKKMNDDLENELREKYGYVDSSNGVTTPNDVTTAQELLQTEADADNTQLQDLPFPQLTPEEYDELAKEFDRRVEEYYRKGFLNRNEVQELEAMVAPY
ncbi:glutamic acid-rich protein-like [Branchiostoma floridae]|uniref:Glutamic acid-rich protein-like n=2 Tax=Branchiostoma floridae TaxID=7739 RepID=A0A9J7KSX2_BRAFL|nr:glutamic acid-rich protein-like [Branchiostoma floridae]